MKSTNFFSKKSQEFIDSLTKLALKTYDLGTPLGNIYGDIKSGDNTQYKIEQESLLDTKFQIELMLSEFDNGNLFVQKLQNFNITYNEPV